MFKDALKFNDDVAVSFLERFIIRFLFSNSIELNVGLSPPYFDSITFAGGEKLLKSSPL